MVFPVKKFYYYQASLVEIRVFKKEYCHPDCTPFRLSVFISFRNKPFLCRNEKSLWIFLERVPSSCQAFFGGRSGINPRLPGCSQASPDTRFAPSRNSPLKPPFRFAFSPGWSFSFFTSLIP